MHSGNEVRKEKLLRERVAYLGERSRIYSDDFGAEPWLLSIGNDVIVASGVSFIEHDASYYTAFRYLGEKADVKGEKMGAIVVEDNCFIGAHSIILGGTLIGKNSIIAAGAVVHGVIPPGEVWGGVPAKFIMKVEDYAIYTRCNAQKLPWIIDNSWLPQDNLERKHKIAEYYQSKLYEGSKQ